MNNNSNDEIEFYVTNLTNEELNKRIYFAFIVGGVITEQLAENIYNNKEIKFDYCGDSEYTVDLIEDFNMNIRKNINTGEWIVSVLVTDELKASYISINTDLKRAVAEMALYCILQAKLKV